MLLYDNLISMLILHFYSPWSPWLAKRKKLHSDFNAFDEAVGSTVLQLLPFTCQKSHITYLMHIYLEWSCVIKVSLSTLFVSITFICLQLLLHQLCLSATIRKLSWSLQTQTMLVIIGNLFVSPQPFIVFLENVHPHHEISCFSTFHNTLYLSIVSEYYYQSESYIFLIHGFVIVILREVKRLRIFAIILHWIDIYSISWVKEVISIRNHCIPHALNLCMKRSRRIAKEERSLVAKEALWVNFMKVLESFLINLTLQDTFHCKVTHYCLVVRPFCSFWLSCSGCHCVTLAIA